MASFEELMRAARERRQKEADAEAQRAAEIEAETARLLRSIRERAAGLLAEVHKAVVALRQVDQEIANRHWKHRRRAPGAGLEAVPDRWAFELLPVTPLTFWVKDDTEEVTVRFNGRERTLGEFARRGIWAWTSEWHDASMESTYKDDYRVRADEALEALLAQIVNYLASLP